MISRGEADGPYRGEMTSAKHIKLQNLKVKVKI